MQYIVLANAYDLLEKTPSRLEKTTIIANLLKQTSDEDIVKITLLLQGKVFPSYDDSPIGIASKLVVKALQTATGLSSEKITSLWQKSGDLGDVAKELSDKKTQATLFSSSLSVNKVFDNIKKLATIQGKGTVDIKLKMIAELLSSAKPLEARFIVRTLLEDLRIGVGDGTLRDAIIEAFFEIDRNNRAEYNELVELTQSAFDVTNDFGMVAKAAKKGRQALQKLELIVGVPIKVMLFQKAKDFKDAFERVGIPAAIEYKFDGFRVQIHKAGEGVQLFTRRLENVTLQFPEVAKWAEQIKAKTCIIDGEIVGIDKKSKAYLPFQNISQRIKRKYEIEKLVEDLPVVVRAFDMLECDGNSYLDAPFSERREKLAHIIKDTESFHLADQKIISTIKEAEEFFKDAIALGNEGVMLKKLDAPYKPGSRVGYGVKVKATLEPLDLVIVAAEWGEGKRSDWLASFTLACKKGDSFLEMGKVGTGVKEKPEEGLSFLELTKMLEPLITKREGRSVTISPKIILEVAYEEIQSSPSYSSGFALRFPRVIRLREDKPVSEIATLAQVKEFYEEQ